MDPGLLRRYNEELAHLREVGSEFARAYPKIAGRLTMSGLEVADPYVERLLEGFAFLAARVQLHVDAEYPRFVQHLLEVVQPGFVAPVPSMAIVRMLPDLLDPALAAGPVVPRGSALLSEEVRGQATRCEFRTAHEVQLWPLEIVEVRCFSHAADLPLHRLPLDRPVRGGLRIRLRSHGPALRDLPIERLSFHVCAPDETALRLHERVCGPVLGSWVAPPAGQDPRRGWRDAGSVRPQGFDDDEALLPETLRGFSGHRLLQEFAAMPQRLLFFAVEQLRERLAAVEGQEAELFILSARADPGLEPLVDRQALALGCTPAINLFPKRLDRIALLPSRWEHPVVPDRTRPLDFEVHTLDEVIGHGTGAQSQQLFLPLYAVPHALEGRHEAWYTVRREPRQLSERQRSQGTRSAWIGTECFLSLVDAAQAPYAQDLRQLSVRAWVSNRDLPLLLPGAGTGGGITGLWSLDTPGPVRRIETLRGPTRPVQRLPRGEEGWSLVRLLALNHLSLAGEDPARAAATLRALLRLFGPDGEAGWQRWVDGLLGVQARTVTRRLPQAGPLTFGSGAEVVLEVDDSAFQGGSAFLFGSVLERYLARHAAINSFVTTRLLSSRRGEIMAWPPRCGTGALL